MCCSYVQAVCAMSLFEKGGLEEAVAEKMGYINYVSTPWERLEGQNGVQRRHTSYHLNRQISQVGSKVSCIQQKTTSDSMKFYVLDEVITLHDVSFGDHFQVFGILHGTQSKDNRVDLTINLQSEGCCYLKDANIISVYVSHEQFLLNMAHDHRK